MTDTQNEGSRMTLDPPIDDALYLAQRQHNAMVAFIRESNAIEGIHRDPSDAEIDATAEFLAVDTVPVEALGKLQAVYAPGKPLRSERGMNVQVGSYVAPEGGLMVAAKLDEMLRMAKYSEPWHLHVAFEKLHPYLDGNGRTGRALWAWMMLRQGRDPFALSFLHQFYYQTLANS